MVCDVVSCISNCYWLHYRMASRMIFVCDENNSLCDWMNGMWLLNIIIAARITYSYGLFSRHSLFTLYDKHITTNFRWWRFSHCCQDSTTGSWNEKYHEYHKKDHTTTNDRRKAKTYYGIIAFPSDPAAVLSSIYPVLVVPLLCFFWSTYCDERVFIIAFHSTVVHIICRRSLILTMVLVEIIVSAMKDRM